MICSKLRIRLWYKKLWLYAKHMVLYVMMLGHFESHSFLCHLYVVSASFSYHGILNRWNGSRSTERASERGVLLFPHPCKKIPLNPLPAVCPHVATFSLSCSYVDIDEAEAAPLLPLSASSTKCRGKHRYDYTTAISLILCSTQN